MVINQVRAQAPKVVARLLREVSTNIDEVLDVNEMLIANIVRDKVLTSADQGGGGTRVQVHRTLWNLLRVRDRVGAVRRVGADQRTADHADLWFRHGFRHRLARP
jgi:hypothetical protein